MLHCPDFLPICLNFVACVSLDRRFLCVQSVTYVNSFIHTFTHSFIHSFIVCDVCVLLYLHSHVSYGVDVEIRGQRLGVGSLLQPYGFQGLSFGSHMVESAFALRAILRPPRAAVCTVQVGGAGSWRVSCGWREASKAGVCNRSL